MENNIFFIYTTKIHDNQPAAFNSMQSGVCSGIEGSGSKSRHLGYLVFGQSKTFSLNHFLFHSSFRTIVFTIFFFLDWFTEQIIIFCTNDMNCTGRPANQITSIEVESIMSIFHSIFGYNDAHTHTHFRKRRNKVCNSHGQHKINVSVIHYIVFTGLNYSVFFSLLLLLFTHH